MTSTMSSWGVRKPMKTYSRGKKRSLDDEEPATKRRRVDNGIEEGREEDALGECIEDDATQCAPALPMSSPKQNSELFSDQPLRSTPPTSPTSQRTSSPRPKRMPSPNTQTPSSPVPQSSSPQLRIRRPIFSFMKRRTEPTTTGSNALSETNHNIQTPPEPRPKKKRLVQMQLDLVGDLRKTCKICGMEYIPSNTEDAMLHRKFHAMNVGGVDFTKAFVHRLRQNQVWAGGDGSFIAVIGRNDGLALRNRASEVLKVVNTELAAVAIPAEALWSQIPTPTPTVRDKDGDGKGQMPDSGKRTCSASDRFKVYVYIRANKCVGVCLAERILEAYSVEVARDDAAQGSGSGQNMAELDSSSISVGTVAEPAMLGISRIWTSNLHRKHGIATRLLEAARSDFLYGMTIDKDMMAFSQPTESGGKLARRWFGKTAGWHVYID